MISPVLPMIFGIHFPNPFDMLSKAFQSAYEWQAGVIEKLIIGQDSTIAQGPLKDLYEANINLAIYIAYAVFGLSLILGVFLAKHRRIGEAFVVWVLVVAFSTLWVPFLGALRDSSINLSKAIAAINTGTSNTNFPMPDNPVVGTVMFLWAFILGFMLAVFVTSFEMMTALMAAWMMPFFALRAIGPRTKKLCNIVWAVGIVGAFLGRPVVTFFIEAGVWMMKTLPFGQTSFGGGVYIIIGYSMAFGSIFVSIFACYHVVNAVDGRVAALASGTVAAFIRKTVKVDIAKLRQQKPRPIPVIIQNPKPTMTQRGKKIATEETKKAVKKAAIKAATAAAAAA